MDAVQSTSDSAMWEVLPYAVAGAAVVTELGAELWQWVSSLSTIGLVGLAVGSVACITKGVNHLVEKRKEAHFQKMIHPYIRDLAAIIKLDDADSGVWDGFTVSMYLRDKPLNTLEEMLREGGRPDVAHLSAKERQDLLFRLISRIDGKLTQHDLRAGGSRGELLVAILRFIAEMPTEDHRNMVNQFGHVIGPWGDAVEELLHMVDV